MNNISLSEKRQLLKDGWIVRKFSDTAVLEFAVRELEKVMGIELDRLHETFKSREDQLETQSKLSNILNDISFTKNIFANEKEFLNSILGPELLIQTSSHLRIHKPNCESDSPGIHRDTFYGNAVEHINCWFPLIELGDGGGLMLGKGSQCVPSLNVRDVSYEDTEREFVTKGSLANKLGFVYAPKIDDSIANLSPHSMQLVSPNVGEYVLFFGNMIHSGANGAERVRVSVDVRFTHPHHISKTNEKYFELYDTGVLYKVKKLFLAKTD